MRQIIPFEGGTIYCPDVNRHSLPEMVRLEMGRAWKGGFQIAHWMTTEKAEALADALLGAASLQISAKRDFDLAGAVPLICDMEG